MGDRTPRRSADLAGFAPRRRARTRSLCRRPAGLGEPDRACHSLYPRGGLPTRDVPFWVHTAGVEGSTAWMAIR
jgi:hypothetical protein